MSSLVFFAVLPSVVPYDHLLPGLHHDQSIASEAVHETHCHLTPGSCADAPVAAGPGQLMCSSAPEVRTRRTRPYPSSTKRLSRRARTRLHRRRRERQRRPARTRRWRPAPTRRYRRARIRPCRRVRTLRRRRTHQYRCRRIPTRRYRRARTQQCQPAPTRRRQRTRRYRRAQSTAVPTSTNTPQPTSTKRGADGDANSCADEHEHACADGDADAGADQHDSSSDEHDSDEHGTAPRTPPCRRDEHADANRQGCSHRAPYPRGRDSDVTPTHREAASRRTRRDRRARRAPVACIRRTDTDSQDRLAGPGHHRRDRREQRRRRGGASAGHHRPDEEGAALLASSESRHTWTVPVLTRRSGCYL